MCTSKIDCRDSVWNPEVKKLMKEYDLHMCGDIDCDTPDGVIEMYPIYAIGDFGDSSVGIQGMFISPWCKFEKDAIEFVATHIDRLRLGLYMGCEVGDWTVLDSFTKQHLG